MVAFARQEITLVLMWREFIMPPAEERTAALAALRADLAQACAWETAVIEEGRFPTRTLDGISSSD